MNPEELHAVSLDGRVNIVASGVYMLARAFKRAREGEYLITRVRPVGATLEHRLWGRAIVDQNGADIRQHDPGLRLKRRILVKAPRRPALGRREVEC